MVGKTPLFILAFMLAEKQTRDVQTFSFFHPDTLHIGWHRLPIRYHHILRRVAPRTPLLWGESANHCTKTLATCAVKILLHSCMHVDRPMLGSNRVPFLKKKIHDDKSDQCIDNSSTRQLPIQHFWHVGGNSGTTLKQTCMSTQQTIVRSAEMIEVMATCCTVGRRWSPTCNHNYNSTFYLNLHVWHERNISLQIASLS